MCLREPADGSVERATCTVQGHLSRREQGRGTKHRLTSPSSSPVRAPMRTVRALSTKGSGTEGKHTGAHRR